MSYTPVIPTGGFTGWAFLKRTMAAQKAAFEAAPAAKRDEAYFREKIGTIKTAEALVADRRLLKVALGAFGLDADINNKYFIRKVLEDGTTKTGALANKLADKQYTKLSAAFGLDLKPPTTLAEGFADRILAQFETRQFEAAVGAQNNDMRLALNAERELPTLAAATSSDMTKWYTILGSTPLRKVFETAFGLPKTFAAIDLDQQVTVMKSRAEAAFGDDGIGQFADPKKLDLLLRRFLARSDATSTVTSPALQLLQASNRASSSSILSLIR